MGEAVREDQRNALSGKPIGSAVAAQEAIQDRANAFGDRVHARSFQLGLRGLEGLLGDNLIQGAASVMLGIVVYVLIFGTVIPMLMG